METTSDASLSLSEGGGGVTLDLWVQPGARRPGCVGIHQGALRVRVAARPEAGAATAEALALVARELGVPVSEVRLLHGRSSRRKRVKVEGVTLACVRVWLDAWLGRTTDGAAG